MKKTILTISLLILTCGCVVAQGGNDAFINDWVGGRGNDAIDSDLIAELPVWTLFGTTQNDEPVGSGLLIMTAFGAGYALRKKLKK